MFNICNPRRRSKQFLSIKEATISTEPKGKGSTFDKLVIFKGQTLSKAMNSEEENFKHFKKQLKIYDEVATYLTKKEEEI